MFFSDTAWPSGFSDLLAAPVVKGRNMRDKRVGSMLGAAMVARRAARRRRRRMWRGGRAMVAAFFGLVGLVGWTSVGAADLLYQE